MFSSTKIIELGSCAFRQPQAKSHCKFLHGYRLIAKFWFEADELDENNWVVDFGGLKKLKLIFQDMFDHTTVIAADDPHIDVFRDLEQKNILVLNILENGVGVERFAEWCCLTADKFVQQMTDGRCRCAKAEVFEHENNSAIYSKQTHKVTDSVDTIDSINTHATDNIKQPTPDSDGASINTNNSKTTNKWVDTKSTNLWGI
jgi:6-pyruvoyltetrahydropterin/6-carboxytetrahydropterin synthase